MDRLKLAPIDNENKNKEVKKEVKKPKIKKPLNAFMLFMKEMRTKIAAECNPYKDSSSINKCLGKQWRLLSLEEQSKYYELAKIEKQQHKLLYPGWTARDNYAKHVKRKKKLFSPDGNLAISGTGGVKKCRARFGLEQRDKWCKPCKTKKRCIKYVSSKSKLEGVDGEMSDNESISLDEGIDDHDNGSISIDEHDNESISIDEHDNESISIDEHNAELDSEEDNILPITVEHDSEDEINDDETVIVIIKENSPSP